MTFKQDIHDILEDLRQKRILDSEIKAAHRMKGTTDGRVYTLAINDELKYVLKLDSPQNICLVERCVQAYPESRLLPIGDYDKVQSLIERISKVETKYLLHGDTGVHNFVFHHFELIGVIDPSPMAGPVTYDFTYAFCSSPDDLNLDTLFAAFELLRHKPIDQSRLVEETIFQLYCRIGICAKVHPKDLAGYLKAWEYWRTLLP
ncbi:phosphotransferase [Paenibacillus oleatilyticus]|uniref:phosphotransferase n=1 Tax=Paenibacillus oleatilyticus TaxID=2594886 RepID=UPI001C1F774D|nr:phosphotransferase [Paenibacillus oleatilyticus]MBU7316999.1 phosphotransferase [Paenibacillus oleatilyticus]